MVLQVFFGRGGMVGALIFLRQWSAPLPVQQTYGAVRMNDEVQRMEQIYFSHTRLIAECPNLNHSVVCMCAVRVKICACQPWQSHTLLYLRWIFAGSVRNPSGPISRSHTASTPLQSSISQTLTLPVATHTAHPSTIQNHLNSPWVVVPPHLCQRLFFLSLFFGWSSKSTSASEWDAGCFLSRFLAALVSRRQVFHNLHIPILQLVQEFTWGFLSFG